MAITKDINRQCVSVAMVDINFGDLTSGADAAAITLPPNAIVVGGAVTVVTAFNSATSDVMDVGDAGSENRYLNDANIHTAGRTALVPTGYIHTGGDITVRWVGVSTAPSAGKVRLEVQYIQSGRAEATYG